MVKIVIDGKLVEISEEELEAEFAPEGGMIERAQILRSLAEKPKQLPTVMEDLGLKKDEHNRMYSRIRYHLVKLNEEGLVGRHKIDAKTVLWFLKEKGLEEIHD